MGLVDYKKKRRFGVTPEPAGKATRGRRTKALVFDFRLEWNGVLLSWAVPKGPSLDPSVKRLAMQVEDHPLEYAAFEGIIPAGEYGGGTVMIWDRGTWTPESPDVGAALRAGELKFALDGEKLAGSWVLVRTRGYPSRGGAGRPTWLLIKHRDDAASDADVVETAPRSVVSQRLLAEIAWQEGGDVVQAADGDPASALRTLIRNPAAVAAQKRRRKPSVWKSKKAGS
jgi:bifunctional non-homologous end joining protein LigD